jgi:hypothetical protein
MWHSRQAYARQHDDGGKRHSRIALTMEIYSQVPDPITRAALRRLSDALDAHPAAEPGHQAPEDGVAGPLAAEAAGTGSGRAGG